ncbi:MAG: hypothetical protein ACFFAN_03820 [Promethearchaeota archaeon]
MIFITIIVLNLIWLILNIIWLRSDYSTINLIIFFLRIIILFVSFASLYPFIKLIFPILTKSEEDFLPSQYNKKFFLIIFIYISILIIWPPFFIPFFMVFLVFSGFASVIELRNGFIEKNIFKLIIPSFTIFGKLYFVYLFPFIIQTYIIISYVLFFFDLIVWFLFLKDHKLFTRMIELYKSVKKHWVNYKFKKIAALLTIISILFYLFSWPIYTEFWEHLIFLSPNQIFTGSSSEEIDPASQIVFQWLPIIQFAAFIMGIVCAIIYLIIYKKELNKSRISS